MTQISKGFSLHSSWSPTGKVLVSMTIFYSLNWDLPNQLSCNNPNCGYCPFLDEDPKTSLRRDINEVTFSYYQTNVIYVMRYKNALNISFLSEKPGCPFWTEKGKHVSVSLRQRRTSPPFIGFTTIYWEIFKNIEKGHQLQISKNTTTNKNVTKFQFKKKRFKEWYKHYCGDWRYKYKKLHQQFDTRHVYY